MKIPIVHIVRRYGPVGGMETYVWRLTHGLADSGLHLTVICEEVLEKPTANIQIIYVEKSAERPRWKAMLSFRFRVNEILRANFDLTRVIVHSHERAISHHITTVHGPLIDEGNRFRLINSLMPRVRGWRAMERHEFLGQSVRLIASVSNHLSNEILKRYPAARKKETITAWPGVEPPILQKCAVSDAPKQTKFLFVGKEWKRKGLDIAIKLFRRYATTIDPDAELHIYGPEPNKLPSRLHNIPGVFLKGWQANIPWQRYSLLIHLARSEPFGMVITEARAYGIPVLASKQVGAIGLNFDGVTVITNEDTFEDIIAKTRSILDNKSLRQSEIRWSWDDLVSLHVVDIYPRIERAFH